MGGAYITIETKTMGVRKVRESDMEDMKKLKRMLLVTSSLGFAVFAMVVITEIVRISL
ncbi:hypothetical protein BAG01nite_02960 [Brevibacillus agri]|uniref:DUF4044 domain-containing protein n=1 Tax=Brevibacillus agri TaxID=51101 RepID=A0ABQ0SNS5_9BACL|nr:hypothetical protein BAG01nite_02960 [Brevibacillus agri]